MNRFPRTLVPFLLLLGGALPLRAGWNSPLQTSKDSGISIDVASPVKEAPSDGFLPVWVTIKNRSGSAHTWQISGEQSNYLHGNGRQSVAQSLRVESGETARTPLLIPLALFPEGTAHYSRVSVEVEGYGMEGSSVSIPTGSVSGGAETAYVGMGDALATPLWASLVQTFKDQSTELRGSPVEVALLPTDWRGLSGFDCLWLTEGEYTSLDADRRAALRDWVTQGGRLLLCTPGLTPALRAGLDLPAEGNEGHPGFGYVQLVPWDGKTPPELESVRTTIQNLDFTEPGSSFADASEWAMTHAVGNVPVNAAFLIAFITVFALVIGPLNLFVWADAKRRHRLFWTTPLIALVASLLLILVIVLQDGFGGHGARSAVTLLLPDQRKAFVVQEQTSRLGLLFSGRFTTAEDLVLSEVSTGDNGARSYKQSGRFYSGDWFTSHHVQAQRVQAIVPTRAEVQIFRAPGADPKTSPTVISSLPATLSQLFYTDLTGTRWHVENLHTGQKALMQLDGNHAGSDELMGSNYLKKLREISDRPGSFYAVADDGPFLDTLSSVRWNKQQAVFVGAVTLAP